MAGIGNYTKKQKGERGFKMEMKEYGKGKSPFLAGEADSTLVSAAQNAAMANKPGDWTQHYDKQNEGLIAASNAKAKMFETGIEGATKIANKFILKNKKKKGEGGNETTGTDKYGSIIEKPKEKDKDDDKSS